MVDKVVEKNLSNKYLKKKKLTTCGGAYDGVGYAGAAAGAP